MAILNFSDVLENVGLDPKRVKLIRHSLGDKAFKKCYDKGMVEEYTRVQSETFSNGYDYWCVFISDKSTTAKFFACYKVSGGVIDTQDTKPKGSPLEDWFQGQRMFYNLERIDLLKEYEGRLLIEWGKSALAWAQKGTNEKPIVAIRDKKIFPATKTRSLPMKSFGRSCRIPRHTNRGTRHFPPSTRSTSLLTGKTDGSMLAPLMARAVCWDAGRTM